MISQGDFIGYKIKSTLVIQNRVELQVEFVAPGACSYFIINRNEDSGDNDINTGRYEDAIQYFNKIVSKYERGNI